MNLKKESNPVIVYNSLNTWWSYQLSFETYFRWSENHRRVYWINLASQNKKKYNVNFNDFINPLIFKKPDKRIQKMAKKFDLDLQHNFIKVKRKKSTKNFMSVHELKNYSVDEFRIGALVYSFLCGKYQSTNFNLDNNKKFVRYLINYGLRVYEQVNTDIQTFNPSLIIVVNDRIISSAAAISAARKNKINANIYYWGSSTDTIIEYSESLYSFDEWSRKIESNWRELESENRIDKEIIKRDFIKTYTNKSDDAIEFQAMAKPGTKFINAPSKKLAVLYAASEWEHSPVFTNRNDNDVFSDQYISFLHVARYLLEEGWEVVLKLHPSRYEKFEENALSEWDSLKSLNGVTILEKDTNIDTYELIEQADLNIVWESNVGLECIARGKPILILGDPYWAGKLSNFRIKNLEQLKDFTTFNKFIVNVEDLLPYFVYIKNFGQKFKYIETQNFKPVYNNYYIIKERFIYKFVKLFLTISHKF